VVSCSRAAERSEDDGGGRDSRPGRVALVDTEAEDRAVSRHFELLAGAQRLAEEKRERVIGDGSGHGGEAHGREKGEIRRRFDADGVASDDEGAGFLAVVEGHGPGLHAWVRGRDPEMRGEAEVGSGGRCSVAKVWEELDGVAAVGENGGVVLRAEVGGV